MATVKQNCPACQKPNFCAVSQGSGSCWCFDLEARLPLGNGAEACYCKDCLERLVQAQAKKPAMLPKGSRS